MTDDRAAFLRAIADQPGDRTARLVFADFLEETGAAADAVRAEFIRTQIEAETVHPNSNRAAELDGRARELFATHWLDWLEPICAAGLPQPYRPVGGVRGWFARRVSTPPDKPGYPYARGWGFGIDVARAPSAAEALRTIRFAGGFPEAVSFLGQLGKSADYIRRWSETAPLARLELYGSLGRDWRVIDGPHLNGLRALELKYGARTVPETVGRSAHLTQLEELRLIPDRSNTGCGEQQYRALALSPLAARINRLISEIGTPAEARELIGAPFRNITALDVRTPRGAWVNPTTLADGVTELVSSVRDGELEELALDVIASGALWRPAMARLPRLRRLEVVPPNSLANPPRFFPSARLFPALDDLTASRLTPEWIDALADWPVTKHLRHLHIDLNVRPEMKESTGASLLRLADALDPAVVETLRIGSAMCSILAVRAALAERFGDRVRFG
jgi:uncharacterized protein (TIGR02996 family)